MDIIDVGKIKVLPSLQEIPVHNNLFPTKRAYCDNIPENSTVVDKLEAIKIITDLDLDLETKPIEQCPILNYIEDLLAVFNPLNVTECNTNLFDDNKYTVIQTTDELKKLLSEILIRFDTNPKNYLKNDFDRLIVLLYRSLLFLYENHPLGAITDKWLNPHSDKRVPSEKLVKETIDNLEYEITESISNLDEKIDQEIDDRQSEILRVDGLVDDINDLIPSEATSSNLLADKAFVHDLIATNASNFRGDWSNWTAVPSDPLYYPEDYTGNKKPNNNDYLIIQNATDYDPTNTGIWRFVYKGDWNTLGKSGWEPQYRVELAFTPELLNAINSGINSTKVSTYDGYLPLILAAL